MNILFLLVPLGLMVVAAMVAAFLWAVRRGQFEDLDNAAVRILLDEDRAP